MHRDVLPLAISLPAVGLVLGLNAQEPSHPPPGGTVALQPLAQQVRRLETALRYLGQPLPETDQLAIDEAVARADESGAVGRLQQILDRHVLAVVQINPESRVKVEQGAARPELVQGGSRVFLVKVHNQAGVTAPLRVQSPNSGRVYIPFSGSPEPKKQLDAAQVRERWADLSITTGRPCVSAFPAWPSST
jgi:hypothetical protein